MALDFDTVDDNNNNDLLPRCRLRTKPYRNTGGEASALRLDHRPSLLAGHLFLSLASRVSSRAAVERYETMDIREEVVEAADRLSNSEEEGTTSRELRLVTLRPSLRVPEVALLAASMLNGSQHHDIHTRLQCVNLYGSLRDDPDSVLRPLVDAVLPDHHLIPNVQVLNLGWNNLEDRHAADVANALKRRANGAAAIGGKSALRSLILNRNSIGDAGARALAEVVVVGVRSCRESLAELNLSGNDVGPDGCRALSSALDNTLAKEKKAQRCGLVVLNLGNNRVGDEGAIAIADGLGNNDTLAVLWLEGNGIGAAGCRALADSLRKNVALCELHLFSNPLTPAGAAALEGTLRHANYALESLLCGWYTGATADQQDRLRDLCDDNRRTKRAFDDMADHHHRVPLGLWPRTLELFEKKPTLVYEVFNAKPDLWDL